MDDSEGTDRLLGRWIKGIHVNALSRRMKYGTCGALVACGSSDSHPTPDVGVRLVALASGRQLSSSRGAMIDQQAIDVICDRGQCDEPAAVLLYASG